MRARTTVLWIVAIACLITSAAPAEKGSSGAGENAPRLREIDRVRLAEAFRLDAALGDRLWPGWKDIPFAVLLVTPDHEFLIRHPRPSDDFRLLGEDSLLESRVYVRDRTQPTNLLATFPAVGGLSTIVVGQAENTESRTSSPWVVVLLHEHFHQLQESGGDYYREVEALGLSKGDASGMWMLNYPFPYEDPAVAKAFRKTARLLREALAARPDGILDAFAAYARARRGLVGELQEDDAKYLEFQLWKEGIARYTEYRIAAFAAEGFEPGEAFRSLEDFTSYADVAKEMRAGIEKALANIALPDHRRVSFYPIGAGEGLLLDRIDPAWRERYFEDRLQLGKFLRAAEESELGSASGGIRSE